MPQPASATLDTSPIEAAIRLIVPQPADPDLSTGIAAAVSEATKDTDWLLPELTAYFPAFADLDQYVAQNHHRRAPLPEKEEPEYKIIRALATSRSQEKLESPYTALMLIMAAHAAHLRRIAPVQAGSDHLRTLAEADKAAGAAQTLASRRIGLNRSDVYIRRKAYLQALRGAGDSLQCAVTLQSLFSAPNQRSEGKQEDKSQPDKDLEVLLRKVIIPLLAGDTLSAKPNSSEEDSKPEEWEFDDPPTPAIPIHMPTVADDDGADDEISIVCDAGTQLDAQALTAAAHVDPTGVAMAQSIHGTNDHFVTLHADVITPDEAWAFGCTWLSKIKTELDSGRGASAAELGVLGLMYATGLTKERAAMAMHPTARLRQPARYLTRDCNFLISPVLGPRPSSTEVDATEVEEPYRDQQIALPLPPTLAHQLRRLREIYPRMAPPMMARPPLESTLRSIAISCGYPSITIGRLRRFASVSIFDYSKDLPATMILCGDTFRRSLAPLHYAGWSTERLEEIFCASIWPHWPSPNDQAKSEMTDRRSTQSVSPERPPRPTGLSARIGSTHHEEQDRLAKSACPKVGGKVHKQSSDRLDRAILAHNQCAAHFGAALIGVAGHRPCESLFRITTLDIDPQMGLAIITDKEIDQAHITRLVALGSKLSFQYRVYIAHLQALMLEDLGEKSKKRVKAAISGRKPMLFGLTESGHATEWTLERWREHLPDAWVKLKSNYSRHSLATISRDRSSNTFMDPNWLAIQLGHYDLVGFPFSSDSPTYPTSLADTAGPLVDHLFKRHGWRYRTGLAGYDTMGSSLGWDELSPLTTWSKQIQKHDQRCYKKRQKLRQHYLKSTFKQRSAAEALLIDVFIQTIPDLATLLAREFNAIRSSRNEPLLELPSLDPENESDLSVEIKKDEWPKHLDQIDLAAGKKEPLRVAARNRLVVGLKRIKQARQYRGMVPPGFPYRALPDPSPFPRSMFRATQQISLLRKHFGTLKPPRKGSDKENALWLVGKTILAWIIYGQITDAKQIKSLLNSCRSMVDRVPASTGSLLVHLSEQEQSVGFFGPAALAHANWIKEGGDALRTLRYLSIDACIEDALQAILPESALPESETLPALLQTMCMMNRIEQSGFQRYCLTPETGSVALSVERCREYLSGAHFTQRQSNHDSATTFVRTVPVNDIKAALDELGKSIPGSDKGTTLKRSGKFLPPERQRSSTNRKAVAHEVTQWISDETQPPIVRQVASWLHYTVLRPKYRGSDKNLEWSSIKDYYGLIRKALVQNIGWFKCEEETDAEELEACYIRAIEHQSGTEGQAAMAVQLMDFHSHLETEYGFDTIDHCLFLPYLPTYKDRVYGVSSNVVLPEESALIQHVMDERATAGDSLAPGVDQRLFQQAAFAQLLISLTGARIAEVAGMQHRDIIIGSDKIFLIFRANGYRGVKTPAARRLVPLCLSKNPKLGEFVEWVRKERNLRQGSLRGSHHLFISWPTASVTGRERLGQLLRSAIHCVNGQVGIHHGRHFNVTEGLATDELGHSPRARSTGDPHCIPRHRLPRDMAQRCYLIGHRKASTGGRCYMHFPAAFSLASQKVHLSESDAKTLACAFGVHASTWRKKDKNTALGDTLEGILKLPSERVSVDIDTVSLKWRARASASRYCHALDSLCGGLSETYVCHALGMSKPEIGALTDSVIAFELAHRVRLLPRGERKRNHYRRWRGGSKALMFLWDQVEIHQNRRYKDLLELIRLSLRGKAERKWMSASKHLNDAIEATAPPDFRLKATRDATKGGKTIVSHDDCDVTREYIWVCCIALAVQDLIGRRLETRDIRMHFPLASI